MPLQEKTWGIVSLIAVLVEAARSRLHGVHAACRPLHRPPSVYRLHRRSGRRHRRLRLMAAESSRGRAPSRRLFSCSPPWRQARPCCSRLSSQTRACDASWQRRSCSCRSPAMFFANKAGAMHNAPVKVDDFYAFVLLGAANRRFLADLRGRAWSHRAGNGFPLRAAGRRLGSRHAPFPGRQARARGGNLHRPHSGHHPATITRDDRRGVDRHGAARRHLARAFHGVFRSSPA